MNTSFHDLRCVGCELIALDVNDPASVNAAVEVSFHGVFDPIG